MNRPKTSSSKAPADAQRDKAKAAESSGKGTRETIESIAVAVILAFLFRAFVAEAFVIPTGSMAPTLQGRHMDVVCEKCSYQYRTGASVENEGKGQVYATTCPLCRFTMDLEKEKNPDQESFNGDRILVSKFSYEFADPKRWDVIVFKYPGNAKQNYIKRLVGLPGESLGILNGDIYTRPNTAPADAPFDIARKPPHKLAAMLQLVDDTHYRAETLGKVGWPEKWQDRHSPSTSPWEERSGAEGFQAASSDGEAWLRYRHVVPWPEDWDDIRQNRRPKRLTEGQVQGELITDYYAYNDGVKFMRNPLDRSRVTAPGMHWVPDLALECNVETKDAAGELALDLVAGGVHYECRLDVATGKAVLNIDRGSKSFADHMGRETKHPTAQTAFRGPGAHRLRFSNCDHELLLWVDERIQLFDGPTTYEPEARVKPKWSADEPGDIEPAGIGVKGLSVVVPRIRLYRDVYYVATNSSEVDNDYENPYSPQRIREVMSSPQQWSGTSLFDDRRETVVFTLGQDQFFPMGDNSPQSRDARVWSHGDNRNPEPPPYVHRDLLTGKALLIYWPHSWRTPVPFTPNFQRMGLIR